MGYAMAMGPCIGCGQPICFNPNSVPSIRHNGEKEPVCLNCWKRRQEHRRSQGLPEEHLRSDAYEAIPEEEL